MYREKRILSLIPARGGSKGVPRKNIRPLAGKPLMAWTIEQAQTSQYVDAVVVSTDDSEIAKISKQYGAQTPFIRPQELATDDAKGIDVVFHAMDWFEAYDTPYDVLMLLQPTSPLRTPADIDCAIELLFAKNADAIIAVCEVEHPPYWSNTLPDDGCLANFLRPELIKTNRQDLPTFYRVNGAVYVAFWEYMRMQKSFWGANTYAYVMPTERSIDIDSELDFKIAEILLQTTIEEPFYIR